MRRLFERALCELTPYVAGGSALFGVTILTLPRVLAQTAVPVQRAPLAQVNLKTIFPKRYTQLLGLTPYGTAVFVAELGYTSNVGDIVLWSISKQKTVKKQQLSKWLSSFDLKLSAGGKWLATSNNRSHISFPDVRAYQVATLRTSDLKIVKSYQLKSNEDTTGYLSTPGDPRHVVMKVQSIIPFPDKSDSYFGHDRFAWLSLQTGKREKVLRYNPARGCDRILFSPDKKYLACLFSDETVESSDDPRDLGSIIDILDAKTGKIVWHIQGTDKRPAGEPMFFISPTRLIAYSTVFNIAQKKARPWNAVNASRRCLAAVPRHPNHALFLTKSGVQLRNWQTDRAIRSWPTITAPGHILFAPDLKMFSFRRGQIVQFWKFDPKWLK